jgi:serine/threonine protein kinase
VNNHIDQQRSSQPLPSEEQLIPSGADDTEALLADNDTAAPGFGPPMVSGEVGTLGPYRIVKELDHGGMGAVYAAIDTRLERRLALKVMLPKFAANPSARERFIREARAAARIKHKDCQELTSLNLGDTQVTDAGLANFKACKHLSYLYLASAMVTDAGPGHIKKCKNLTFLSVKSTKVTVRGLADFAAAVPTCRIEHDGGIIEPKK